MTSLSKLITLLILLTALVSADSPVVTAHSAGHSQLAAGYSVLRLFLQDEQHLTTIRRVKMLVSFSGISEPSTRLIDSINDSAEQALIKLERLATLRPAIDFINYPDENIGKATFDSLRQATAKEFLFDTDHFEKNLLLSQFKVLRVISHLAAQLAEKEPNHRRKRWLEKLAARYESHYQKINHRISLRP